MNEMVVDKPMKTQHQTWIDIMRTNAVHVPHAKAFTFLVNGEDEQRCVTYGELDSLSRSLAVVLSKIAKPGDRVLLLYPQGIDFVIALFACLYSGLIAVPLYAPQNRRKSAMISRVAQDCTATWALSTAEVIDKYQNSLSHSVDMPAMTWMATDVIDMKLADEWVEPEITGESIAYLQYTSGSTSSPKGVVLNHSAVLAQAEEIIDAWGTTTQSVMVSWLPHYHDFGLVFGILQPIYQGFHAILLTPAAFVQQPLRWLSAITKYHATHSAAPNFAFDHCVDNISDEQLTTLDLRSWVTAANGAEPVRMSTLTRFFEKFKSVGVRMTSFSPAYGLAEATLRVTAIGWEDTPRSYTFDSTELAKMHVVPVGDEMPTSHVLASCGVPVGDTVVAIVNPETRERTCDNEIGEIWVSSSCIATGYWGKVALSEEIFRARICNESNTEVHKAERTWLRTGDLGFLYAGELFVASRIKDLIVIRGANHYPQDIEETVEESHTLLRPGFSAAFSIDNGESEQLVVVVERKRYFDESFNYNDVMSVMREMIAEQHGIDVFAVVIIKTGTIPKTTSGKIQRAACKALYLSGELHVLSSWQADVQSEKLDERRAEAVLGLSMSDVIRVSVGERVAASVAKIKQIEFSSVQLIKPLTHYGVNSMDMLELHTDIGGWLGYEIPDDWIWESKSIGELVDRITNTYGQQVIG